MQFPESWLRALVNPPLDTDALAHALTMAGLEVEETTPVAPAFSGVVAAHVLAVEPHPNADKLRVCRVSDGQSELQIVCGAPNVAQGLKVPLARVGASLPGGMSIGVARMRGVESSGMLCSARELGLSQDHAGLMVLPADTPLGLDLRQAMALDDTLFTLKLTPNKADCLSVLGVAREVSAITGAPLSVPSRPAVPVTLSEVLPVRIEAPDLCGRFSGRIIRGVDPSRPTPDWMRQRLERAGQRSISALVDISNYVMLELGRPTHVFDLSKIRGGLTVRWAREGETLELLNGQTVTLDPWFGVITDDHEVESLAGIMGGERTSVGDDTRDIYVEAAFWWPESIAGRARRLNFSTDAGHRFERGVDAATTVEHLDYLSSLILEICGGQAGPIDDQILQLPERKPVSLRVARCARVLGVALSGEQIVELLGRLGLKPELRDGVVTVVPPSWRFDLSIEEDLIEEVARLYGFENIPDVPPMARAAMHRHVEWKRGPHELRHRVAALGYQEVVNFAFVEEQGERDMVGNADPIRLLNPIASQLAVMRSSLMPGLLANVVNNVKRKADRVRVFELGRAFLRNPQAADGPLSVAGVDQPMMLAAMAWGPAAPRQWGVADRAVDFFDIKGDLEALGPDLSFERASHPMLHPGRSARVLWQGRPVGWVGEVHPRWVQQQGLHSAPVVFEVLLEALQSLEPIQASEPSRQPPVQRDLALWVGPTVQAGVLLEDVRALAQQENLENADFALIRDVTLFDVWRDTKQNSGERSLAIRLVLQDTSATLEDARVDTLIARLCDILAQRHGARLRT